MTQRGFTMIELLIVVVLLSITAAIALPNFSRMIDSNQRASAANDISGLLNFARAEAVRRSNGVTVYARNASDASRGYAVCIQASLAACKAGTANGEQLLRTTNDLPGSVTLSQTTPSTAADLVFNGRGMASQQFVYQLCGRSGTPVINIEVNRGGQIRINDNTNAICP
ncbi:GspH/FimT family pseudopilin [uncultured Marinobacter sp.]|uniref:GspH/FimT family pseudopilin n=1 Tax=uncultured Marinobacter sp. TaxID=187379 RepID=UPI00261FDC6D|nr:GspH/FimT family pseudopilin [uncultured Marinobacter sp.]